METALDDKPARLTIPKLNRRQRRFAELVAAGSTQAAAYREAYVADCTDNQAYSGGSRLARNPQVKAAIEAFLHEFHSLKIMAREQKLEYLSDVVRATKDKLDDSATVPDALGAIKILNTMEGHDAPIKVAAQFSLAAIGAAAPAATDPLRAVQATVLPSSTNDE